MNMPYPFPSIQKLPLPANIKAATDEDVIAAVGSENLAAVRVRFPEIEQ